MSLSADPPPGPSAGDQEDEGVICSGGESSRTGIRRRCWDEAFASSDYSSKSNSPIGEGEEMMLTGGDSGDKIPAGEEDKKSHKITCEAHPGCFKRFSSVHEYEEHYNIRHRHKCAVCKRSLPSAHILEMHVLEGHDTLFSMMAERKAMLQCFLETCSKVFWDREERKSHCLEEHSFPKSFKLWDLVSKPKSNHLSDKTVKDKKKTGQKGGVKLKVEKVKEEDGKTSTAGNANEMGPIEMMETDGGGKEKGKLGSSSSKDKLTTKKHPPPGNNGKLTPTHITFGHSASRVFQAKYSFGISKPGNDKVASGMMDLSEIKDVLPDASSKMSE